LLESLPWYKLVPHPEWAECSTAKAANTPLGFDGVNWIWFPEGNPLEDAPVAKRFFRRDFKLPADKRVASACLRVSCDDRCAIWLNGNALGEHADWKIGREFSGLEKKLNTENNFLAIEAENRPAPVTKNPAGLICRLEVRFADNTTLRVDSDAAWQAAKTAPAAWQGVDFDASRWSTAKQLGVYGCGPWGKLTDPKNSGLSFCAGISDEFRLIYLLEPNAVEVRALKAGTRYTAQWFNPVNGLRQPAFMLDADARGSTVAIPPSDEPHDWVLVVNLAAP